MTDRFEYEGYKIVNGRIANPGKFEGEPAYVVYFWDAFLNGFADEDDGETLTFDVTDDDRAKFPELAEIKTVYLWETEAGFVCRKVRAEAVRWAKEQAG